MLLGLLFGLGGMARKYVLDFVAQGGRSLPRARVGARYSLLRASTGSMREARWAGYTPKNTPTPREKVKERTTE